MRYAVRPCRRLALSPTRRAYAATAIGAVLLDQATKLAVYTTLREGRDEVVLVPDLLSIVHAENRAASFGMLDGVPYRYAAFLVLALVMAAATLLTVLRMPAHDRVTGVALGLVAGGALGNAVDRAWKGPVTDFVRLHVGSGPVHDLLVSTFGTSDWPAFNVADTSLFAGLALFLVHLAAPDEPEDEPAGAAPAG